MYPTPNSFYFVIFPAALILLAALRSLWQKKSQKQQQVVVSGPSASLQAEPTMVMVSPADLTPPPKYEDITPPSYEEVLRDHQGTPPQPIVYPTTTAVAQSSTNTTRNEEAPSQSTVVTVTTEDRLTSVTVATT